MIWELEKIIYERMGDTYIRHGDYLADIDEQAQERFEGLVEQLKQAQGITEQLKTKNALEWIRRMNNIHMSAREFVEKEIIFA